MVMSVSDQQQAEDMSIAEQNSAMSPLDVLSRAATMVESVNLSSKPEPRSVNPPTNPSVRTSLESLTASSNRSSSDSINLSGRSNGTAGVGVTSPKEEISSQVTARRSNSFKEIHPKFRKHTTPEYRTTAETVRANKLYRQSSLTNCAATSTASSQTWEEPNSPPSASNSTLYPTPSTSHSTLYSSSSPSPSFTSTHFLPSSTSTSPLSSSHFLPATSSPHFRPSSASSPHFLPSSSSSSSPHFLPSSSASPVDDDVPLDFSLKRQTSSPSPPPPYRNPKARQFSPPHNRVLHVPAVPAYPSAAYFDPPPYGRGAPRPASLSPPPPPAVGRRPPPPSYEMAMAAKPTSPPTRVPVTNPTFLTLHSRPTLSSFLAVSQPPLQVKQEHSSETSPPRGVAGPPNVDGVSPPRGCPTVLTPMDTTSDNKENKTEIRKITIVEENGVSSLEEHFRKSLGEEYSKLFKKEEETSMDTREQEDPVKAFRDDVEMSGYTVEDHFAKALGETWTKLQKDAEKKQQLVAS